MGELTMEQVRDRIAMLMGWKQPGASPAGSGISCHRWWRVLNAELRQYESTNHPIPSSLDGIAALWPKGWGFEVSLSNWWSDCSGEGNHANAIKYQAVAHKMTENYSDEGKCIVGEECDTELEARTRLLLAVLEAQQKGDDNAK